MPLQPRRRRRPFPGPEDVRAALRLPWLIDAGDHEGTASRAHELAVEKLEVFAPFAVKSGLILAGAGEYLVLDSQAVDCGASSVLAKVLLVRPSSDLRRWNLRVLHELAHALLKQSRRPHSHGDVWALTLALAVPREAFRLRAEAHHVPRWAIQLRGETARAIARAA